ncbi:MAG: tetratricopeptide repeat protein [Planctomycetes bacterium]|nr:tetratricopeptide repeat protein [Planctomycetota bacterium]MBI3843614.1 tetratricopeptide repeat protein [Planctomycetota bacterium]
MKPPVRTSPSTTREIVLVVAIFCLALVVRIAYHLEYDARYGVDTTRLAQLDSNTFDLGARAIVAGDVFQRNVYYPYHWWNEAVAPRAEWESWYHPPTFHQTPLYLYFVAALYAIAGCVPAIVTWSQAIIGALVAVLVYAIGRRSFGRPVAAIAAIWTALLGSLFFYDVFLLRESLVGFVFLVTAACFDLALRRDARPAWWIATGVALGVAFLAKETALALFAVMLLWPLHPDMRGERYGPRTARLVAGFALALLPFAIRNVAVGAPVLAFSTRGPWEFVNGNASASSGVEWFPEETRRALLDGQAKAIFLRSRGSFSSAAAATLETHAERPLGFLSLQWRKLAAFWNGYEFPNNVDAYVVASRVSLLRWAPGFWPMGALAIVGLALSLRRFRERFVAYGFVTVIVFATVAFYVLARFRVPALPFLSLFAALTLVESWRFAAAKRWGALAATILAASVLSILTRPSRTAPGPSTCAILYAQSLLEEARYPQDLRVDAGVRALVTALPPDRIEALETRAVAALDEARSAAVTDGDAERITSALCCQLGDYWMRRGQFARAEIEFRAALDHARSDDERAVALVDLGNVRFQLGSLDDALRRYDEALALQPRNKAAYYGKGSAYQKLGNLPDAADQLEQAIAVDPAYTDAHAQLGFIYDAMGKSDRALEHLRKGLVHQTNPAVERAIRDLVRKLESK